MTRFKIDTDKIIEIKFDNYLLENKKPKNLKFLYFGNG